jgi:hypothetical protein
MRLPQIVDADGKQRVDREKAVAMIRYAIDNGVNYLDSSYVYHNGESEEVIGMALRDGYRKRVHIATKVPPRILGDRDEMKRIIETQLTRLGTDYIDCYLIHHIDKGNWERVLELRMIEMFEQFKAEGLIGAICFSYHGQLPTFREIVNAYPWAMCQVQHNFLDEKREVTLEGIRLAHEKGMAFVVMEPLRGGGLASAPSEVQALYDAFPTKRNPVEWAFRFVYDIPEVSCILSGVTTMDQLKEDIEIFAEAHPNSMTDDERLLLQNAKAVYDRKTKVGCTGCEYCMPCPNKVPISRIFGIYNRAYMFDQLDAAKRDYERTSQRSGSALQCVECGICQSHCPQGISIIEELKKAHEALK